MKHTPGPWKFLPSKFGFSLTSEDRKVHICQVSALDGHETNDANADLIAAAPEMLEMLEEIHDLLFYDPEMKDKINRIIEKARGES